jgi:hypothetical protein
MKPWGLLLLLPTAALAQPGMPAGYGCIHMQYENGVPYSCEALGSQAADNSFTYYFDNSAASFQADPQAVPEISSRGAWTAMTLLSGLCLCYLDSRRRRVTALTPLE